MDDDGEGFSPLQSPLAPGESLLPSRKENEAGEDSTSKQSRKTSLDVDRNRRHLTARRIESKRFPQPTLKRQQPKTSRTKVGKAGRKITRLTRASYRLAQRRRRASPAKQLRDKKLIQAALDKSSEEELDPRIHGPKDAQEMMAQGYDMEDIYWETEDEPLSDDPSIVAHLYFPFFHMFSPALRLDN